MRLARFAVAGLVAGVAVGFAVALIRPARPKAPVDERPSVDVRGPVGWGTRPSAVTVDPPVVHR